MAEQNRREILEDIISSTLELMVMTREQKKELDEIETELEALNATGKLSPLSYDVQNERIRRSRNDVRHCMRSLERQRKIAIEALHELPGA